MSQALSDLLASYESKVTTAKKAVTAGRKSLKAQRKAVVSKSATVSSKGHTCWLYGEDKSGQPLTGAIARCVECANVGVMPSVPNAWAPPVPFDIWARRNYDVKLQTRESALDAGRADVVIAYDRYVRDTFGQPFSQSVFERIVAREQAKQNAGLGDLGLLGYSATDIVSIAVLYAWAERIKSYAIAIGADSDTAAHISQALRDFRSTLELMDIAELEGDGRYVFGSDGRLRKQANSLAVRHARERIELRHELRTSGLLAGFAGYVPTAGEVYRQVNHVFREGMREWRSSIEGLSRDGVIPESIQFSALAVGDTVDETLFVKTEVDETHLAREAWLDEVKSRHDLLPAEARAAFVTEALLRGYKLYEIREEFNSEQDFRTAIRDAQLLFVA